MNKGHQDAHNLPVHLSTEGTTRAYGEGEPAGELETVSVSASVKDGDLLVSFDESRRQEPVTVNFDLRGGAVTDLTGRDPHRLRAERSQPSR